MYALISGEQYMRHSRVRSCFARWFHMSTVRTRIIARAFSMQGGIVVVVALFGCVRLSVCLSGRLSVMWCVCEAGTGAGPESSRATLLHTYMPRTCTYRSHRARRTPPAQPCCKSPDGILWSRASSSLQGAAPAALHARKAVHLSTPPRLPEKPERPGTWCR